MRSSASKKAGLYCIQSVSDGIPDSGADGDHNPCQLSSLQNNKRRTLPLVALDDVYSVITEYFYQVEYFCILYHFCVWFYVVLVYLLYGFVLVCFTCMFPYFFVCFFSHSPILCFVWAMFHEIIRLIA